MNPRGWVMKKENLNNKIVGKEEIFMSADYSRGER